MTPGPTIYVETPGRQGPARIYWEQDVTIFDESAEAGAKTGRAKTEGRR